MASIFIARNINRVLSTTIGPWDVGQLDDALIDAITAMLQPLPVHIPIDVAIEKRKREIRTAYWRKLGQLPPG